ncbi:hypothetical protein VTN02DRAFT_3811 [Thermoascus thermophilus]
MSHQTAGYKCLLFCLTWCLGLFSTAAITNWHPTSILWTVLVQYILVAAPDCQRAWRSHVDFLARAVTHVRADTVSGERHAQSVRFCLLKQAATSKIQPCKRADSRRWSRDWALDGLDTQWARRGWRLSAVLAANMAANRETETSPQLNIEQQHETLAPEEGWRILSISNSRCWLVGTVQLYSVQCLEGGFTATRYRGGSTETTRVPKLRQLKKLSGYRFEDWHGHGVPGRMWPLRSTEVRRRCVRARLGRPGICSDKNNDKRRWSNRITL